MKKTLFILTLTLMSLVSTANEVKFTSKLTKYTDVSESVKFLIDYECNEIYVNIGDSYKDRVFNFENISTNNFDNSFTLETIAKDDTSIVVISLLFYKDGNSYFTIRDLKNNSKTICKIN